MVTILGKISRASVMIFLLVFSLMFLGMWAVLEFVFGKKKVNRWVFG